MPLPPRSPKVRKSEPTPQAFVGGVFEETSEEHNPTAQLDPELAEYYREIMDSEDPSELIAFNLQTCEGTGILDGGASRSVGGFDILEKLQKKYNEVQQEMEVLHSNVGFTFAGGEKADAKTTCIFKPAAFDWQPVGIHAVERPSPILLGLDNLRHYQLNVDYMYNAVWSHSLGRYLDVELLPSGHLAVDLSPLNGSE